MFLRKLKPYVWIGTRKVEHFCLVGNLSLMLEGYIDYTLEWLNRLA